MARLFISENFFDREWTELELKTLLERQNDEGQKLILPILHNITTEQLRNKYPTVADIQAIAFVTQIVLWIAVILTVVSLVDYLVKNKDVMKDK